MHKFPVFSPFLLPGVLGQVEWVAIKIRIANSSPSLANSSAVGLSSSSCSSMRLPISTSTSSVGTLSGITTVSSADRTSIPNASNRRDSTTNQQG